MDRIVGATCVRCDATILRNLLVHLRLYDSGSGHPLLRLYSPSAPAHTQLEAAAYGSHGPEAAYCTRPTRYALAINSRTDAPTSFRDGRVTCGRACPKTPATGASTSR